MNLPHASHAGTAATPIREFLAFKLGSEEYGIDILRVQEIRSYERPTRIANAPDFIKGVVNLRGVIVPIIDMRLKFRLEQATYDHFTVVIVLNIGRRVMGIVVDAVSDVITLTPEQLASGARVQCRDRKRPPAGHRRGRRTHADPGGHRKAHVRRRDRPGRADPAMSARPAAPRPDGPREPLKVSTRLALLAGTLAAVLLAVGGLGLHGIGRSERALKAVYEERTAADRAAGPDADAAAGRPAGRGQRAAGADAAASSRPRPRRSRPTSPRRRRSGTPTSPRR